MRAQTFEATEAGDTPDPWSFELRDGIICRAEVIPPDRATGFQWSLANFYCQDDADAQPELAARLGQVLTERGIKRAYAPSVATRSSDGTVTHSIDIVDREDLSTRILLPGDSQMFRNKSLPGGGVAIRRGEAMVMSGAGCPPHMLAGKGFCIGMHVSRDTLVDRNLLVDKPARSAPSIVHAAVSYLEERHGVERAKMSLKGGLHIPPWEFLHPLDDPDWGEHNTRLFQHLLFTYGPGILDQNGEFDLEKLVQAICTKLSVRMSFGRPLPKRASTTRDEDKGVMRNLVLVYRLQ